AAQLSTVLHRRVWRVEDRRHRRPAESHLYRVRARRAAARSRHRDHRHADAVLRARQEGAAANSAAARGGDEHQGIFSAGAPAVVLFLPLPLFHVYGNVGVQALSMINNSAIALVPNPRDVADLLATIRRVKPSFFNGVPTLYNALLGHADVRSGKVDFKSIRLCFSGASALLAETKSRFESMTGGRIVEGYSLTEAMMALCVNPVKGPNKIGSVGMP